MLLASSLGSLSLPSGQSAPASPGSPPPGPVAIYGESDLQSMALAEECYGSGSILDPYVVENRTIAWYGAGAAIYVANTTSHLIIRNCTLAGAPSSDMMSYSYGVQVTNASNVKIDHCEIGNFSKDIMVGSGGTVGGCDNISVSNSSIYGPANGQSVTGIDMSNVDHAIIENNLVTGSYTGLYLFDFTDGQVRSNNISFNYGNGCGCPAAAPETSSPAI